MYSFFFLLNASDLYPSLEIQTITLPPFMFLLSQIIQVNDVNLFGALTGVTFDSFFQVE